MSAVSSALLCTGLAAALAICAGDAYAQDVDGSGALSGKATEKFPTCRHKQEKVEIRTDFTLFTDGRWISADSQGNTFEGTSVAVGKGGKRNLTVDYNSRWALADRMYAKVRAACGGTGLLTATTQKARLTVNKKGTKAKLILKHKINSLDPMMIFRGPKIGKAVIKARGPWTAGP